MYRLLRPTLLFLLQAPAGPPDPPTGDATQALVFRAAPQYLAYRLVMFFLQTLPGLGVSMLFFGQFVANYEGELPITSGFVWVAVLAVFVCSAFMRYFLLRLDYDLRYYVVTDRSLRIRQGAWHIEEATFTFANIQNLTIHQGPVERLLGIANVHVETAGGGAATAEGRGMAHHGVLAGIQDAESVRDRILALLKRYRDAGLGNEAPSLQPSGPHVAEDGPASAPGWVPLLTELRDEFVRLEWAMGPRLPGPPPKNHP